MINYDRLVEYLNDPHRGAILPHSKEVREKASEPWKLVWRLWVKDLAGEDSWKFQGEYASKAGVLWSERAYAKTAPPWYASPLAYERPDEPGAGVDEHGNPNPLPSFSEATGWIGACDELDDRRRRHGSDYPWNHPDNADLTLKSGRAIPRAPLLQISWDIKQVACDTVEKHHLLLTT